MQLLMRLLWPPWCLQVIPATHGPEAAEDAARVQTGLGPSADALWQVQQPAEGLLSGSSAGPRVSQGSEERDTEQADGTQRSGQQVAPADSPSQAQERSLTSTQQAPPCASAGGTPQAEASTSAGAASVDRQQPAEPSVGGTQRKGRARRRAPGAGDRVQGFFLHRDDLPMDLLLPSSVQLHLCVNGVLTSDEEEVSGYPVGPCTWYWC